MKKIISILFVLALVCSVLAVPVSADTNTYVYDKTSSFTSSEIAELNSLAQEVYDKYTFGIYYYATNESHESDTVLENAAKIYEEIGGSKNGILLYNTAKYWYVYCSGIADLYFSTDDKQVLWDAFMSDSTYFEGVKNYINKAETYLNGTSGSSGYVILEDQHYDEQGIFATDDAGLLSSDELKKLNDKLAEINQRQGFIVAVATTNSFNGKSVVAYSDDLFEERYSTVADGAILTINMTTRDWYISTEGFGITALTDYGIEYIGEQIVSDLKGGDYYDAFVKYADLCDEFVTQAKTGEPYDVGNMPKPPYNVPLGIFGSLLTGGISSLIGVTGMKGKLKSVFVRNDAAGYSLNNSFNLANQDDVFLYNTVSKTRRVEESSSRGGGGGSSYHSSSSGTSHGGGGGKF